ncbi:MAG: flavodoxin family protein [Bacillales bacterium]|jgi:multimeric flavodoxin WrbA|nr:flavodoxin family protein [Bacillales bacterium]
MRVILINGSPRVNGCTYTGLNIIKEQLKKNDIEATIYNLGNQAIQGCIGCGKCKEIKRCIFNDLVNVVAQDLENAEGLIIGSPVYFSSASGSIISFLDRLFYSIDRRKLKMKFGASIVSCRRGGATATFDQLNKYFTISEMPLVSSSYWNQIHGNNPQEVQEDLEGIRTLKVLANNMAYLIKCQKKADLPLPEELPLVHTNFIK